MADLHEVENTVKLWAPRFGLHDWEFVFVQSNAPDSEDFSKAFPTSAQVEADPVYMRARITILPPFDDLTAKQREEHLVHELSHCITNPYDRMLDDFRAGEFVPLKKQTDLDENVTERIAQMMLKAWRH